MSIFILKDGQAIDLDAVQHVGPTITDGQGKSRFSVYMFAHEVSIEDDISQEDFVELWCEDRGNDQLTSTEPKPMSEIDGYIDQLIADLTTAHYTQLELIVQGDLSRADFLDYLKKATETFANFQS